MPPVAISVHKTPIQHVRLLTHSNKNINELAGKYYDASQFIDTVASRYFFNAT